MELILVLVSLKVIESITDWNGMVCISGCL